MRREINLAQERPEAADHANHREDEQQAFDEPQVGREEFVDETGRR